MEALDRVAHEGGLIGAGTPHFDTSKPFPPPGEILADLQKKAAHNYFRVLQAYERLNPTEPSGRGKQNLGETLTRELERERARIARELHAGAGQPLAGIKFNLDTLRSASELSPGTRKSVDRLQVLADQALDQVRAVSHRLYPPDWQRLGLAEAIESVWISSGVTQKFDARLEIPPLHHEPSHSVKVTLYRCVQECLSNLLRHSGATRVVLTLSQERNRIVLTIEDNGTGFDVANALSPGSRSHGIGLLAMREQVASLEGFLMIQSGPGGTKLEVSLPCAED